jgi:RNA polymerase sigma-70 factor, ECF subfamily
VVGDTGDEIAELFHAFYEEVRAYCAYRLFSRDLAEDAVLDVFLRLTDEYPVLRDRSRPDIRRWLYGTASNVTAKYLRDRNRQKRIVAELVLQKKESRDEVSVADNRLDWPTFYEAISRLNPKEQSIVTLRYFQELDNAEIAKALGMTRVGVKVRLHRAIRALRRELGVKDER